MSNTSERRLPQVKIALFGPSLSGKTAFLRTLLGKSVTDLAPNTDVERVNLTRTFYKIVEGRKVPLETYNLQIIDLPGRDNFENMRVLNLAKCTGVILFYDSTDPNSAQLLVKMVEEELIGGGFIPNILALVVVGTKKDLNPDREAINIAAHIVAVLRRESEKLWNYSVPHLLINALDRREVEAILYILESLLISLTLPKDLVKRLSVEKQLLEVPRKPIKEISVEKKPVIKVEEKPKVIEKEKVVEKQILKPLEVEYRLFPIDKLWQILTELGQSFEEIESMLLVRKASDTQVYVAFYPGERTEENIPRDLAETVLKIDASISKLLGIEDIGNLSHIILYGTTKTIILLKKKAGILAVKVKGRPSEELLDLLLR